MAVASSYDMLEMMKQQTDKNTNPILWNPWGELEHMSSRLRTLFDQGVREGHASMTQTDWIPPVDVEETDNHQYVIHAEVPAVKKDDLRIRVKDGVLSLEGERRYRHEDTKGKFHRVERRYGTFARRFTLPDDIDEKKLKANYDEGMVNIVLPKSSEANSRSFDIRID